MLKFKLSVNFCLVLCLLSAPLAEAGGQRSRAASPSAAAPTQGKIKIDLSAEDQQIQKDLEDVLTTENEVIGGMQRDNLSLLEAALKYDKDTAWINFVASAFITFWVVRLPFKYSSSIITNISRSIGSWRAGNALLDAKWIGPEELSNAINMTNMGMVLAISGIYITTRLYQKGVCIFSCTESIAHRVTDSQEVIFLKSPTYKKIETEIGVAPALRFFGILKTIRNTNYSNEDSLHAMRRFEASIDLEKAPTFARVAQIINGVFLINQAVIQYLIETGQFA